MMDTLQEFLANGRGLDGPLGAALRIAAILLAAWLVSALLRRGLRSVNQRVAARMEDAEAAKRAETLARVFRYIASVILGLITVVLVLSELGISVAPILGAAGVVGVAVGFGAQSLVKDFFTGFVLLLENQIRQGDVVKLGDHAGVVENLTLRYVQLRDYDGQVHFVPNGQIDTVVNLSRGYAHAVIDAGVGYGADVDQVMALMHQVAVEMRADPAWADQITADFEMAGVNEWGDSAVTVRGRFRTLPGKQWGVRREMLRRLKYAFDAAGIEIPFPQRTVHLVKSGPDEDELAAQAGAA